jgi:hypothetical protein
MNKVAKTLFWIGISWSILCLSVLTVRHYFPLEFSNENTARGFYGLIGCTFPIAFLLTLVRQSNGGVYKAIAIFIAIISIPILALYAFSSGMCGYTTDKILFINKSDSSLKIIERHFDCGALDSDMPKYEYYKMKPLTSQILYSKKIDTLLIDKDDWIRNALK